MYSKFFRLSVAVFLLLLAACSAHHPIRGEETSPGMKTIILDGPRDHWVHQMSNKLQANGFNVLRKYSSAQKDPVFAKARYSVVVHAQDLQTFAQSCQGGKYRLEIDLVDSETNKIVESFLESGFFRGCGMSGDIVSLETINKISTTLFNLPE